MGVLNREAGEIHAKIVYWGASGSGKTANAKLIQRKLKRDHRGDLTVSKTESKPTAEYEFLAVELGMVRGLQTSIHLHTTPGGDPHEDERRRLLDGTDGIVFVADLRPERHEETLASFEELKNHLKSYGRSLDDVILVVQYNHRDEADENALDDLHRNLGVKSATHLESVASEGTGVLPCLTSISKLILARIREQADQESEEAPPIEAAPIDATEEADAVLEVDVEQIEGEDGASGYRLVTAGSVEISGSELRIPIRLIEETSGREIDLSLRLSLDA
jgi:signal recognition particle receptor subunit beta